MDDDKSGTIDKQEFCKAIKELRAGLSDHDIDRLFKLFDINNDGTIAYDEFMKIVVGELNETRRQCVDAAFGKLDRTGDGVVTLEDLRDLYKPDRHPDVLAKRRTEGEVLSEFLDTLEQHYGITVSCIAHCIASQLEGPQHHPR
jgi:Ca2+-binding EF-hand superfamily protein